jgi:hypothetical protein
MAGYGFGVWVVWEREVRERGKGSEVDVGMVGLKGFGGLGSRKVLLECITSRGILLIVSKRIISGLPILSKTSEFYVDATVRGRQ